MQRLLGVFLSFLLIFSAVITGLAPQASAAEKELKLQKVDLKRLVEKEETISKEEAELFAPDEKVRVVVEVEGEPAIEEATKQNKKFTALKESVRKQLEKKLLTEQEKVKDEIAVEGVQIEYINEFTTVFNGFSGEVKFGDIEKIEKLDKVKNVYILQFLR
ncbi:protease inhibitor I9 family protein [Pallidibacillus pasinlerensis]|uniref:Inhibitor I9 domain-containing protein n=1 Tax=Pallidibacillus pasinlerensis TaxID=2703818 RepID=A0ABX0A6B6_9BACI|nr:protease inhibitor I9 family protein [Pallidibacillus pasinlerensis]NCU16717.1 hypothetical protein [Pallidibacillus pasinlerensis]